MSHEEHIKSLGQIKNSKEKPHAIRPTNCVVSISIITYQHADYWTDPRKLQIQFEALESDLEAVGVDYLVVLLVAQRGPWLYDETQMSVFRRHPRGLWSGAESQSAKIEEKERFFRLLAEEPEFKALRPEIISSRRMELRQWAAAEAREGKWRLSIRRFIGSIGGQDRDAPRYMSPLRYFWALLSPVRRLWG